MHSNLRAQPSAAPPSAFAPGRNPSRYTKRAAVLACALLGFAVVAVGLVLVDVTLFLLGATAVLGSSPAPTKD